MMDEVPEESLFLKFTSSREIHIEFENVSLAVPQGLKHGKKQILKGVSGKFQSGELTAIMGPSGAGKTSLLNILTGFRCTGMKGVIKSSGSNQHKIGTNQYKKECCYILQDDQLAPYFTVSEIMNMAANLKLGRNLSEKAKLIIVENILDTLSLSICKDTRCSRLSGGQKKRLSIALELIDNPPVMFLDEPTTGLDSSSSLQCITTLKNLARGGRTIVCTIHQPSATIYEMFDHVYVMADGRCIYKGASVNTVAYLSSVGLFCPEYHNPADYLLEVANGEYGDFTELLSKAAEDPSWRGVYKATNLELDQYKPLADDINNVTYQKPFMQIHPPSELRKFWILWQRMLLQLYRDWTVTHLKLFLHIIVGIFIGLFHFNIGNDASRVFSNVGYLLITLVYLCYTAMMPAVLKFPSELPVLKKERFNNWYRLNTYYAAFIVSDIPVQVVFCLAYTSISYFITSQPLEWYRFFMFLSICCLVNITAESIGILLGTTVNPVNGTFLGAISIAFMLTLAGFLIFLTHMAKPFYILSNISYLRYGVQGLAHAIYGYGRGYIPCPEDAFYCQYTFPEVFLKEIGMAENTYWMSSGILLGMIVFLRVVTFYTLKRRLSNS